MADNELLREFSLTCKDKLKDNETLEDRVHQEFIAADESLQKKLLISAIRQSDSVDYANSKEVKQKEALQSLDFKFWLLKSVSVFLMTMIGGLVCLIAAVFIYSMIKTGQTPDITLVFQAIKTFLETLVNVVPH